MTKKFSLPIILFLLSISIPAFGSILSVETDYRLRGISYSSTEIFATTSTNTSLSYYSQRLMISLRGNFDQNIEIGSKLTSLGIVSTTNTVFLVPYPKTDFTPYVENAYVKFKNLGEKPVDLIIGKQSLCYGTGLIVCDNGTGFNTIRLTGHCDLALPFFKSTILPINAEYFTAKVQETLNLSSDADVYGGLLKLEINKNLWEFGYFGEDDFSGTQYVRGSNIYNTKAIVKRFLDLRIGKKEDISEYQIEIAKQTGYVTRTDGVAINFDGMGYLFYGKLVNEKTRLGKVAARALISYASGNDDPYSFSDDKSFSPTYTKRYDGMERGGYGMIFGASPVESFFNIPIGYSGINTLNIGTDISPIYNWTFCLDYFLFSASQAPKGSPEASGFEKFYGANFSLGSEVDLSLKFIHSKYSDIGFAYSIYSPPQASAYWPNPKTVNSLRFEASARF
ncbi:MAG: hypothetical protein NT145_04925 [Elusimicrobia bacterium]|nr:hypothetical protein [Elusimicrobiota bacterium]